MTFESLIHLVWGNCAPSPRRAHSCSRTSPACAGFWSRTARPGPHRPCWSPCPPGTPSGSHRRRWTRRTSLQRSSGSGAELVRPGSARPAVPVRCGERELARLAVELDKALALVRQPFADLGDAEAVQAERARLGSCGWWPWRTGRLSGQRGRPCHGGGRPGRVDPGAAAPRVLWALLVVALVRGGRRADALEALRRVRCSRRRAGLEPGPALQRLERRCCARTRCWPGRRPRADPKGAPNLAGPNGRWSADASNWTRSSNSSAARSTGFPGFGMVVGEPGIGKTRLLQELGASCRPGLSGRDQPYSRTRVRAMALARNRPAAHGALDRRIRSRPRRGHARVEQYVFMTTSTYCYQLTGLFYVTAREICSGLREPQGRYKSASVGWVEA